MSSENTSFMFAENVLLLGAGFTKNFGGLLASEMWAEIFNNEIIQAQPRIKKLMQNNFDYESIYYSVLEGLRDENSIFSSIKFRKNEKNAIEVATRAAYDRIDEILIDHQISNYTNWINTVNKLLLEFGKTNNNGFIFTLNQDLFIERFYQNPPQDPSFRYHKAKLIIPGVEKSPNWFMNRRALFDYQRTTYLETREKVVTTEEEVKQFYKLKDDEYCTLPNKNKFESIKSSLLNKGSYFLLKLHGSYNWKSSDGLNVMVIGRGKKEKIQNEPLLKYYFEIFDKVLSQEKRRLLIIGYGFRDEHINSVISKAITDHDLRVYILSPESPEKFKEKLCEGHEKSEDTNIIWKGISGYFQCVKDVLLKDVYGSQFEKEHFYNIFFGKDNYKW